MGLKQKQISYESHDSLQGLTESEKALIQESRDAFEDAYAPYSEFRVGAAILFEDGTSLKGANQENASYPLCNCAEQVALNHAAMAHSKKTIKSMAIAVDSKKLGENPISPCGACRQIILEYEQKQKSPIKIYLVSYTDKVFIFDSIKQLLPFYFEFS